MNGSYLKCIPLRTHIFCPGEDIKAIVHRYVAKIVRSGDVLAIAETPLAIVQGRIILPENVKIGLLARIASRFTGKEGSLTSPATMQLAIQMAGKRKALLGFLFAVLGKCLGKRGLFYQTVGPEIKLIDDVSGTMAPYERFIVLGPANADKIAEDLKQQLNAPVMIVDANDLGKVDLVGISTGFSVELQQACLAALTANPFGNAHEQTPIVLIRPELRLENGR